MSVRRQMLLYFSGVMIVIFALTEFLNGYQAYGLLEKNLTMTITETLNLGIKSMDSYFEDAGNVCSSIIADQNTQEMLHQEIGEDLDGRILERELGKVIAQYASTHPYITKVYLLDRDGKVLTPELRGVDIENYIGEMDGGSELKISRLHEAKYIGGATTKVFSLVKPIFAYNDKETQIGMIVADVDYELLASVVGDYALPMNGAMLLSDRQGSLLLLKEGGSLTWDEVSFLEDDSLSDDSMLTLDGKRYRNIGQRSQITNLKLSVLIPEGEFIRSVFSKMWLTFLLLIFGLAVISVVTGKIIRSIMQPLTLLDESVKRIEKGDFDTRIFYDREDEFSALISGFNLMAEKIRALLEEVVHKEKTKRNAELYALQAQINPHFLYNTLNSIRYFAKVYHAPEIREMTTALIKLSKASLSSEKYISIRQELELTEHYLSLQRQRYGDVFQVNVCVEETVLDCLIPRFSIQPIVENALFHGILPKGNGTICIDIQNKNDGISIIVSDDGIGISSEKLQEMNERLQGGVYSGDAGADMSRLKNIGLENINYRIRMHYGCTDGGIQLLAGETGVRIILWIPEKIWQENQND